MAVVKGCHLVGSVPMEDTDAVLRNCTTGIPNRLKRIPDGETGIRNYFVYFQSLLWPTSLQPKIELNVLPEAREFTDEEYQEGLKLLKATEINTGYDDAAIESYKVFRRLKDEGVIPREVRFQVCMTTLGNVVGAYVEKALQPEAEKIYEEALFRAMRNIQSKIPHEELAIQLDMSVEMLYWEDAWATPWWSDKQHMVEYIARMANQVEKDVELGLHFCYGDMEHRHVIEPKSLQGVVDFANNILNKCDRPATFLHCPVPLSALDTLDEYFNPLSTLIPRLQKDGTELYLGLVHAENLEATRKMIEAASKVAPEFGVATECGWGRTPESHIQSIMEISTAVSSPLDKLPGENEVEVKKHRRRSSKWLKWPLKFIQKQRAMFK